MSNQTPWFRFDSILKGMPPRPARAFAGTSASGIQPVIPFGAASGA
jgi:hypothetical protein